MHPSSYAHMAALVERYLAGHASLTVVDLGSFDVNGCFRPLFSREGWSYTGMDVAAGPNVDVVLGDPYHLPTADDAVDVAVSGSTFEHVEQFWRLFEEMCRIVKPGGMLFLIAPSRGPEHRYPVDCWRFYTDGMAALARLAGVELVEAHTDWESTEHHGSAVWGDTVGVFRVPVPPAFEAEEDGLRKLGSGLWVPAATSAHEAALLDEILAGREYLLPALPAQWRDKLVLDVGANVGAFATFARAAFPSARILAFEPSPRSLPALRRNAAALGVEVRPVALSAEAGSRTLRLGGCSSGMTDSFHPNRLSSSEEVEVAVEDAAELCALGEIALLKLDTEGEEVPILRRLGRALGAIVSVLCEFHSEADRRAIDALLAPSHLQYFAQARVPHRGTVGYLQRAVCREGGLGFRAIERGP